MKKIFFLFLSLLFGSWVEGFSAVLRGDLDLQDIAEYIRSHLNLKEECDKSYAVVNDGLRIKRGLESDPGFVPNVGKPPPVIPPAPDVFAYTDSCGEKAGVMCWCKEYTPTTPCTWQTDCKCVTHMTCGPTQPAVLHEDKWCNPMVSPPPPPYAHTVECLDKVTIPFCTTTMYTPCATFTPPCMHASPKVAPTCSCPTVQTCLDTTKCCFNEEPDGMRGLNSLLLEQKKKEQSKFCVNPELHKKQVSIDNREFKEGNVVDQANSNEDEPANQAVEAESSMASRGVGDTSKMKSAIDENSLSDKEIAQVNDMSAIDSHKLSREKVLKRHYGR